MTPREELELFRKVERLEEAMMIAGLIPRPAVPEKVTPERILCTVISESVRFWGENKKFTPCCIRFTHCGLEQDVTLNSFSGFGDYMFRCGECKKQLVTDVRWQVKNAKAKEI
jgi:hypothetical protein